MYWYNGHYARDSVVFMERHINNEWDKEPDALRYTLLVSNMEVMTFVGRVTIISSNGAHSN